MIGFWEAGCVKDAAWQTDVKEAINMPLVPDAGKFFLTWEWCWKKVFQHLSGGCLREPPPTLHALKSPTVSLLSLITLWKEMFLISCRGFQVLWVQGPCLRCCSLSAHVASRAPDIEWSPDNYCEMKNSIKCSGFPITSTSIFSVISSPSEMG